MKEDLGFGTLGNGVTVWDRIRKEHGDYLTVAHISRQRKVTFYDKQLSTGARKAIFSFARKSNIRMSVTQPEFVMLSPLGVADKVLEKTRKMYSKIAGEDIKVRTVDYSDDIYAFGTEGGCLKLAQYFAGKRLRIKHSNSHIWMFVIFEDLK
ncbi:MAG TPA: hypothetical protein PKC55_14775 [Dysgonomonas sp.]|uniref:hypothetical protein n=1 Tax=unclassified Dysgonomonas TaxID=2630389 RepID=UPI0025B7E8A9|nr:MULTISPECIES: hypothetical protein [unclassified Dysgonomonas]HML66093.1 hypothetical protein [Dysgonomonas sp.]